MFNTLYNDIAPILTSEYPGKVNLIFRQQIQPWHPSSTLVHEAALAVERVSPDKFWEYSKAIFDNQKEYFDVNVVNETRNATYLRLAGKARRVGVDAQKVYRLLVVPDKVEEGQENVGNGVTDDVKLIVKAARLTGVHVSPTVVFNGVVEGGISSGWTVEQWREWLKKNIV